MPPVRLRIAIAADAQAVLAVLLQGVTSLAFHTGEVEDVDDDSGHAVSAKENHSYGGDGDARNRPSSEAQKPKTFRVAAFYAQKLYGRSAQNRFSRQA